MDLTARQSVPAYAWIGFDDSISWAVVSRLPFLRSWSASLATAATPHRTRYSGYGISGRSKAPRIGLPFSCCKAKEKPWAAACSEITPPWLKLLGVFLVNVNSKGVIFSLNCWSHSLKRVSADAWSPASCFNKASFVIIVFCLTMMFYMIKVICSPLSSFRFIFLVFRLRCSILPSVGWCSLLLRCLL